YNRTVLVIWPKGSAKDLGVSVGDVYDYACNALKNSLTVSPTKKEKKLVDQLVECCRTRRQEPKLRQVVQVLRESADRWNDVQMLLRAVKACGVDKNSELMGLEGFVSAYQAFGWDALKDFYVGAADSFAVYTDAMTNDESNARRHALLARLTQMAVDEEDAEVSAWCKDQGDCILRSLSKIDAAQIPWLTDLGLARGGEFLRDVYVFPPPQHRLGLIFILRMADIPSTSATVVQGLIVQCVTETVRTLPAFPTKVVKSPYPYPGLAADREEKDSGATLEVIKLCIDTKNEALCGEISTKMRDAASRGTYSSQFPPWLYYTELSPALILYMQSVATPNTLDIIFRPFFLDVITSLASTARVSPTGNPITPCGISALQQRLNATTLKGHDSTALQALVRSIVKEFPRQQLAPGATQAYDDLVITLVRTAIDTFDTSFVSRSAHRANANGSFSGLSPLLRARLWWTTYPMFSRRSCRFCKDTCRSPKKVMAQKPSEVIPAAQLQAIGCQGCAECPQLRAFLLSDKPTISFSRVQGIRTHLERQLNAIRWLGVTCETIRHGSPHTLKITKPASMTALDGKTLLGALGDPATQMRVLGADHSWVHARIHGSPSVPLPLANANQNLTAQKRTAPDVQPGFMAVSKKPRQ
ncbi:hypothetical protein B0H16DRAFT_1543711, partial [Mycena metata]